MFPLQKRINNIYKTSSKLIVTHQNRKKIYIFPLGLAKKLQTLEIIFTTNPINVFKSYMILVCQSIGTPSGLILCSPLLSLLPAFWYPSLCGGFGISDGLIRKECCGQLLCSRKWRQWWWRPSTIEGSYISTGILLVLLLLKLETNKQKHIP